MTGFDDILRSLNSDQAELASTWQDIAAVWQDAVARQFSQQVVDPLETQLFEIQMALQKVSDAVDEFYANVR